MSDALEKLKSLGAQKIYEDTHIPVRHVQAILDENYEGFSRMQFLGFVSILERDYDIDLQEIKSHAIEYYDAQMATQPLADAGIFVTPSKQKNFTIFYIVVALFIFLLALYYTLGVANEANNTNTTAVQIKTPLKQTGEQAVVPQTKKIPIVSDVNSSEKEQNLTKQVEQKVVKIAEKSEPLEILPRSKVWLGYINVATNKKHQKTFSNELDLNASNEWLFIFGHGYIDVIVNGEKRHFSDKNTLRLHYKDGVLEKISTDEFKKLNRGRKW
ncbi:hypothetical protein [Sulfurimonas sp.]|uniref:hypothetical protein n=1 Tax=Sulfurimonas sp. TaxID=2022749 RepID=UPI0026265D51|nr:hypothetical protein [Sulfurimonas sp.]